MNKMIEQIKKHEGFRGQPYLCSAGKTTIGYGRNLEANPLTEDEAEILLRNDVAKVVEDLQEGILCWHKLNDARKAVLINMMFNLGVSGFYGFRKFIAALEQGFFELAAKEMLDSKWSFQVGERSVELARQMTTGEWQ